MPNQDRNWLGMTVGHTALQQFKACHEPFSLHNGLSWEATGVFFLQVILFNKPDKLCFARRQARQDQKGRYLGEKRQRLTPLNQLSSKYFIVHCMELRGRRRWQLTVSRLVWNGWQNELIHLTHCIKMMICNSNTKLLKWLWSTQRRVGCTFWQI